MSRSLYLFALLLLLSSCGSKNEENQAENTPAVQIPRSDPPPSKTILISNIEYLRLRSVPGPQGEILENLPNGSSMEYLGEMSSFRTEVNLRGITFDEPWIKVRTDAGIEGWVFAGALNFKLDDSSSLPEQLMEIRLTSLFGEPLAAEIKAYRNAYRKAQTDLDLNDQYHVGTALREKMVAKMDQFIVVDDYEHLPDLFWLQQALPALQPQLVAEGTAYYLFHNYATWEERAQKTSGVEDDAFFNLCLDLFKMDSIEYFWPDYFLQTWDYGGHSELGSGKHLDLIRKMDKTIRQSPSFADLIQEMKADLLNDILGPEVTYWNNQESILQELGQILKEPVTILSQEDIIALKQREKQFNAPEANKIELNFGSDPSGN
ncbi:MAG: SH3 domain-containing protein [Saprospiraceae bacterium]|nr:SH3 domain-containing protein [Saprospiraceae bacterium]